MIPKEYEPFCKEREKSLKRFKKMEIIEIYREVCIRLLKEQELKLD